MARMAPPLASNNPRQEGQTVSHRAMQGNGETKMEAWVEVCCPIVLINALHHRTPAHETAYMATKPQQIGQGPLRLNQHAAAQKLGHPSAPRTIYRQAREHQSEFTVACSMPDFTPS